MDGTPWRDECSICSRGASTSWRAWRSRWADRESNPDRRIKSRPPRSRLASVEERSHWKSIFCRPRAAAISVGLGESTSHLRDTGCSLPASKAARQSPLCIATSGRPDGRLAESLFYRPPPTSGTRFHDQAEDVPRRCSEARRVPRPERRLSWSTRPTRKDLVALGPLVRTGL